LSEFPFVHFLFDCRSVTSAYGQTHAYTDREKK